MKNSLISRGVSYIGLAKEMRQLKKSDGDQVTENARQHLVERMGKLRGLPQKLGQIMSMKEEEASDEFLPLCNAAQALDPDLILQCLAESWKQEPYEVLSEFAEEGHAASLGQVHRARLHSNEEVAIKVQYPGIAKAVITDLKALGWMSGIVGSLKRGFDMGDYRQEIKRDLLEELDYEHEANQQQRFAQDFQHKSWLIPQIDSKYSTDSVLVSQWLEGESIDEAELWPSEDRQKLAASILEGFIGQIFDLGWFHADPHPGNFAFLNNDSDPKVILYDFGSMAKINRQQQLALLALMEHAFSGKGDPTRAFIQLGFDENLLTPMGDKLSQLCRILFEPFSAVRDYDLNQWNQGDRVSELLEDDRWSFRMSAKAELLFLMRAFHGIVFYMNKLQAPFGWRKYVQAHIQEKQSEIDLLLASSPDSQQEVQSQSLRIRVLENGSAKVLLKFKAECAERLDELMGEELLERVLDKGIDVRGIIAKVIASNFSPGLLFELEEQSNERGVRVWLE